MNMGPVELRCIRLLASIAVLGLAQSVLAVSSSAFARAAGPHGDDG